MSGNNKIVKGAEQQRQWRENDTETGTMLMRTRAEATMTVASVFNVIFTSQEIGM